MQAKARISYTLALPGEGGRHKFGVNALALTANPPGQAGWAGAASLFTGGRDSKIRRWDVSALDSGAPATRRLTESIPCVATYEDHSDWVNDLVVAPQHDLLISGSSDNTLKLWSLAKPNATKPRATLHTHTDYVKALAYAPDAGIVVSASLDKTIHIYKLDSLKHVAATGGGTSTAGSIGGGGFGGSNSGVGAGSGDWASGSDGGAAPIVAAGHKDSVYSVAISAGGTLIASGSVEADIRLWDARTGRKHGKLVGHGDVVRALLLDADGRLAISASSDRTVRLWDVGSQRCVHVCRPHADAAWALAIDDSWRTLFSAGRDGCVFATELEGFTSLLLAREPAPVVRLAADTRGQRLWCATSLSDLKCWSLAAVPAALAAGERQTEAGSGGFGADERGAHEVPNARGAPAAGGGAAAAAAGCAQGVGGRGAQTGGAVSRQRAFSASSGASTARRRGRSESPLEGEPVALIAGAPAVQAHVVLSDKWRVLTRDTAERVTLWDVLRCKVITSFAPGRRLEDVAAELHVERAVPTWFSVDTRAGDLAICLDEKTAFSGLLYADDVGLKGPTVAEDATINLGWNMLTTLFAPWVEAQRAKGAEVASRAKAGPIVQLEAPPQSLSIAISEGGRVSVRTSAEDVRSVPEHKVPHWVSETLLAHRFYTREKAKVPFFVVPDASRSLSALVDGSSRLEALRILRMRQVIRYVAQNLATPIVLPEGGAGSAEVAWEEHIEILCNDKVLHPDVDLYSARLLVWRNTSEDMVLVYRRRSPPQ